MDNPTKVFRVVYEQREMKRCTGCCTDDSHPWTPQSQKADSYKDADRIMDTLYDGDFYEYRNVSIEYTEIGSWATYHHWEHQSWYYNPATTERLVALVDEVWP